MKIFFIILLIAVWQDMRFRSIGKWPLFLAGGLGIGTCVYYGRDWKQILGSISVGFLILAFSRVTRGRIGEGDGWFFVVSGLFLGMKENMLLILSGLFFCSIYSLVLSVLAFTEGGNIRKLRIPFLPFLMPVGLWLVLF